jgi:hypothetical protein
MQLTNNDNSCMLQTVQGVMRKPDLGLNGMFLFMFFVGSSRVSCSVWSDFYIPFYGCRGPFQKLLDSDSLEFDVWRPVLSVLINSAYIPSNLTCISK